MKNKTKTKKVFTSAYRKQDGFSLVEIMIYLAIFTIISILVINSFLIVMSSFTTTRTNRDLLESGINSMERLSREIRQANNVDLIGSNLAGGILQLNSKDQLSNPVVLKFSKENFLLNVYQDGVLSGNLLGQNISLDNLVFRQIITAKSEAVKIEMTIRDTRSKKNKTVNFYNTIILRGGY